MSSYGIKSKEMQDELRKNDQQIQSLRSTLTAKQDLINANSAIHRSCGAILADYQKVKSDLKSAQDAKESAQKQTRDTELRMKTLEEQLWHFEKLKSDLKATKDAKEFAETQARDAELRVKTLEEQLILVPHNISSFLKGVYFVCIVCRLQMFVSFCMMYV